jgi:S-adenosylmethionine/arginine decarboxylase-like enzyme
MEVLGTAGVALLRAAVATFIESKVPGTLYMGSEMPSLWEDQFSMNVEVLGRCMYQHSFTLSGVLSKVQWLLFMRGLTRVMGMKAVGKASIWDYPAGGMGGTGQTIVQPITDSFLAVDTWPDHKGAYLVICSCRPFNPHKVIMECKEYGLSVTGETGHIMRII